MIRKKSGHIVSSSFSPSILLLISRADHRSFYRRSRRDCTDEFVVCTKLLCLSPLTEMIIADYNASKAAIISLNESLRYELDKRCVRRSQTTERHLIPVTQLSYAPDSYQPCHPRPHPDTSFLYRPVSQQPAFPILLPFLRANHRRKSNHRSTGRAAFAGDLPAVLCELHFTASLTS